MPEIAKTKTDFLFDAKTPLLEQHLRSSSASPAWHAKETMYEGWMLYSKQWNFWVRATATPTSNAADYFPNYEAVTPDVRALLGDCGYVGGIRETSEEVVWHRIASVWQWYRDRVDNNNDAYAAIPTGPIGWPSIEEYATYYVQNNRRLVVAACFSKAHLFATILGRVITNRFRIGVALAHHTLQNAPPTASHVYVGAYVADRWFYFDPTEAPYSAFPTFTDRRSVGPLLFEREVDYQHPFDFMPVPRSGFGHVPYLSA